MWMMFEERQVGQDVLQFEQHPRCCCLESYVEFVQWPIHILNIWSVLNKMVFWVCIFRSLLVFLECWRVEMGNCCAIFIVFLEDSFCGGIILTWVTSKGDLLWFPLLKRVLIIMVISFIHLNKQTNKHTIQSWHIMIEKLGLKDGLWNKRSST